MCTKYKQHTTDAVHRNFILWTRHKEFEILVYVWYKNSISHVYHLSVCAKHGSVFSTEPIDGIYYVFHAYMPGVQLAVFGYRLSIVASIVVLWRRRVGADSAVSHQVFWKPAKISMGCAKYMANQKRYTTVMPGIYYYQFVISKL